MKILANFYIFNQFYTIKNMQYGFSQFQLYNNKKNIKTNTCMIRFLLHYLNFHDLDPVTNICFLWLANQIGYEWMQLAIYLGFRLDEIERITMDTLRTTEKILTLLDQWRKWQPLDRNLVPILRTALNACGRRDLALKLEGRALYHHAHCNIQKCVLNCYVLVMGFVFYLNL